MSTDKRMAVAALALEEAGRHGVTLQGTPDGKLRWRCRGQLPDLLRRLFLEHKAELLALLRVNTWDQAEAERLLAELQSQVERIRQDFGSNPPVELANVLRDAVAIGADLVGRHEQESAHGWDTLGMLRGLQAHVARCVENTKRMRPAPAG